jgi:hypothetical protein
VLDGLEIFDKDEEITTDDFLADRAAPDHLPKALAPDGHLPTAMSRDDGSPVDVCSNLGHGEVPATPLGNTREIGRWRAQGRGGWAITVSCHAMTRAAIAYKVLPPCAHRLTWDRRWWLLRRRRCHPQECLPHDHHTRNEPLHIFSPVCQGWRRSPYGAHVWTACRGCGQVVTIVSGDTPPSRRPCPISTRGAVPRIEPISYASESGWSRKNSICYCSHGIRLANAV